MSQVYRITSISALQDHYSFQEKRKKPRICPKSHQT